MPEFGMSTWPRPNPSQAIPIAARGAYVPFPDLSFSGLTVGAMLYLGRHPSEGARAICDTMVRVLLRLNIYIGGGIDGQPWDA